MKKLDLKKPPLGWNSFDSFDSMLNEKYFYDNLDVFTKKLKPYGYEYFIIDIAWYVVPLNPNYNKAGIVIREDNLKKDFAIDKWGRYLPSSVFFPNGFTPLIKKVHDEGLKFGLHLMRGVPRKAVEEKMPILGTNGITADMIVNDDPEDLCPWSTLNIGIDMSKPGAQEYYDSLIALMSEWEVDFIKVDDIEKNAEEMKALYKAIDKVDREMVLSLSLGSYHYMKEQLPLSTYTGANMMRITHDIWDNRDDLLDSFEAWTQRSIQEPERPQWFFFDLDMIPFGRLKKNNSTDQYADIDSIPVGNGYERNCKFTPAQMRTFITQRAMISSPLFMGGHLPETDDYSFKLITDRNMLSCNQNAVTGHPVCRKENYYVFRTPEKGFGQKKGWVGIFNISLGEIKIEISKEKLGLSRKTNNYKLYNIWNEKQLKFSDGKLSVELASDDVMFLRYEEAEEMGHIEK